MLQGIKCVVRGADHIAKNKICQDAAGIFKGENYVIAVVADGHGSDKYVRSEIGSRFAVEAVRETVDAFMENFEQFSWAIKENENYICKKMQEQFLCRWCVKVENYHDENPLSEMEIEILKKEKAIEKDFYSMYGSTVLFAVMTNNYYYGMLIGDGGFIIVNTDGSVNVPIEDRRSYANYCSSICSKNSIMAFEKFVRDGKPISMTVSTDGLIKSFASEEDFQDYHLLLASMLSDAEACSASLEKNLHNRTHNGSGDDISVAIIFDSKLVIEQKEIINRCVEAGKKRRLNEKEKKKTQMLQLKRLASQSAETQNRQFQQSESCLPNYQIKKPYSNRSVQPSEVAFKNENVNPHGPAKHDLVKEYEFSNIEFMEDTQQRLARDVQQMMGSMADIVNDTKELIYDVTSRRKKR